jgi:hypothetical protein
MDWSILWQRSKGTNMRTLATLFLLFIVAAPGSAQWVQVNGPTSAGLGCLAADTMGHVYAASDSLWFRSTDNGETWESMPFSGTQWAGGKFCIGHDNMVFAGTWHGISRSSTFGTTWGSAALVDTAISALNVGADGNMYAGTAPSLPPNTWKGSIYRTTNNGVSWIQCAPSWAPTSVEAIAVTPQGTMFVAQISHITTTGLIMRSTDAGLDWETVYQCGRDTMIHALASGPDGTLFAGTTSTDYGSGSGGKALRSTDNGQTWTSLHGGLPEAPVWSFLFAGSGRIFLSTLGVYASTDNGTTWIPANPGLPNTSVYSLASSGSSLFAGTWKSGVFRIPLSNVTAVEGPAAPRPVQYVLFQNYPNPFNPSTTIRFGLPQRSPVTLRVFNTLGEQVAQLVNGEMDAGYHELGFDGAGLTSGVYFYRLQAGDVAQTKKLILLQ